MAQLIKQIKILTIGIGAHARGNIIIYINNSCNITATAIQDSWS